MGESESTEKNFSYKIVKDFCVREGSIYALVANVNANVSNVSGDTTTTYLTNGYLNSYNANTGALVKTYGLSGSMPVSSSDVKNFCCPQKIVAIKPQKLVIADAGFDQGFTDSSTPATSNVNRVFSFDLERKILKHEADLGFSLVGRTSFSPHVLED